MNVIVSNRQKEIIDNANIDAIKDLNGLFNVDDLINKFKNYFFSKMILDATSIINFASRNVLSKLATEIGGDKLVILLPSTPEPPIEFKKLLVDLGIYNFSNNISDVINYLSTPNTYENAMNSIMNSFNGSGFYVDNSIRDNSMNNNQNMNNMTPPMNNNNSNMNLFNQNMNNNFNQQNQGMFNGNNSNQFANSLGATMNAMNINQNMNNMAPPMNNNMSNMNYPNQVDNSQTNNFNMMNNNQNNMDMFDNNIQNTVTNNELETGMETLNNNQNFNDNIVNDTGSSYEDVVVDNDKEKDDNFYESTVGGSIANKFVIGLRNVTEHAGSTTLTYLLRKLADVKMKKNACAVEINKDDFKFYHDDKMISVQENMVINAIKSIEANIVFVDLNNCKDVSFCSEVIYLLEPSIIKLNKLMAESKFIFKSLNNKKVILNKSLLSSNDVKALANEAGIDIFYNLEPLNDRVSNNSVIKLLEMLDVK